MNEQAKISVIIPSYNRAHILIKAVNSVLSQTYKNIELILVDDCSTDNTKEVVKEITDPRFKYFCLEKNSGACTARNRGIDEATGDYIAFNDSDDQWHENKLAKQLEFLTKNNADIVCCSMKVYDEVKNENLFDFPDKKLVKEGQVSFEELLAYNSTSTQLLFGKASCFKELHFDPLMPRFQDWEECLRLSKKYKLFHQEEVLVNTFIQSDSITKNPQKGLKAMEILFEKNQDSILSSPDITEAFFKKMSSFSCRTGKNPVMEMKYIKQAKPGFINSLKYFLAKIHLYKILFNIKNN